MNKLIPARAAILTELLHACRMGTGRIVATLGAGIVMAPVLFIALMPLALVALVLIPPVGVWLAATSLLGGDSSL